MDNDSVTGPPGSPNLASSVRLLLHAKENSVQYLVGILIAHQVGLLDSLWTYGSGVCV